jgi:hypothetical protein
MHGSTFVTIVRLSLEPGPSVAIRHLERRVEPELPPATTGRSARRYVARIAPVTVLIALLAGEWALLAHAHDAVVIDSGPSARRAVFIGTDIEIASPGVGDTIVLNRSRQVIKLLRIDYDDYQGRDYAPGSVTLLCSGRHRALHEGHLTITGHAPDLNVVWSNGGIEADLTDVDVSTSSVGDERVAESDEAELADCCTNGASPHVGRDELCAGAHPPTPQTSMKSPKPSNYECAGKKTDAVRAMKQTGFSKEEARTFVEQAAAQLPRTTSTAEIVRKALRIYRHSTAGACLSR